MSLRTIQGIDKVVGEGDELLGVLVRKLGNQMSSLLTRATTRASQSAHQIAGIKGHGSLIGHDGILSLYSEKPSTMTVPLLGSWCMSMKPSFAASRKSMLNER